VQHVHVVYPWVTVQAIIDGRSRRVDCQQLDMTGLDSKPLRRISINTVMAGFGPDANAVAERRRWMGPMRYSISVKTEILKLPMRKPLPCTLAIDGAPPQPLRDLFLFGCFVNKYTGVEHRITPFAQLDDGDAHPHAFPEPAPAPAPAPKLKPEPERNPEPTPHPTLTPTATLTPTLTLSLCIQASSTSCTPTRR